MNESIFHAYDIRGVYPTEINEETFKRIAQAYAKFTGAKTVAVGRDVRTSGPSLQKAVIEGLNEAGVNVIDIGQGTTDMLYFAVGYYHYDGGIQVSASHNPAEFNGLKLMRAGAQAISEDTGLKEIEEIANSDENLSNQVKGETKTRDIVEDYLDFLAQFAEFESIQPTKIVANANFGMSGQVAEKLLKRLGVNAIEIVKLNFNPDGTFPKGRPDPLIPENRLETSQLILREKADLGVAWDADGDRCFFFDEEGTFVEGSHTGALLIQYLLKKHPDEKILYDPRNIFAATGAIQENGGVGLLNKVGHTFIKNRMRTEDALFAAELSGHFYFRDFYYADNGLIPFLLMLNILNENPNKKLSEIVQPLRQKYFVSGEANFKVEDKEAAIRAIENHFSGGKIDRTDGLSSEFENWRFNVRPSNTENLLRLNVEAYSETLCQEKTAELKKFLESLSTPVAS